MVKEFFYNLAFYCKNPVCIAAVVLACLFYSGIIPYPDRHPYSCVVAVPQIECIEGTVCRSPAKNTRGSYYTSAMELSLARGKAGSFTVEGEASGRLGVLFPSSVVESLAPGRLSLSQDKENVLVECGERLRCTGLWSERYRAFIVTDIRQLDHGDSVWARCMHLRALCRLAFKRLLYGWGAAGGLVLSLLAGSREYTEPVVGESFSRAGLSHILALSGMHLSFFSGLTGGLWERISGKRGSMAARALGILAFLWFAGASPSLTRAALFSAVMMTCSASFCRNPDALAVLAATFLLQMACCPADLQTVAAELSYCSLLGILLLGKLTGGFLVRMLPPVLALPVAASLCAQMATSPLSLCIFGKVMPVGIAASVVVSPLVSLFMTAALTGICSCLAVPFLSPLFGGILNALYALISCIVTVCARVPPIAIGHP